jgi:hypothetical protein
MFADEEILFASPFENLILDTNTIEVYQWQEASNQFEFYDNEMYLLNGYKLKNYEYNKLYNMMGNFNTGQISGNLTFSNQGINLIGNPYPSAIDAEMITFKNNMQKTIYQYNLQNNEISVYQQGGLSINGGSNIIQPYSAFFVVTSQPDVFTIDNNARVHFFADTNKKAVNNSLILQIQENGKTDETALIFGTGNDNYDSTDDAIKFPQLSNDYIEIYSVSTDDMPLCIDSRQMFDTTTIIPLKIKASSTNDITISIKENNLNFNGSIYIYDILNDTIAAISQSSSYTFTYNEGELDRDFSLMFGNTITNIQETNDNYYNLNVFAQGKSVFIIANRNIENINIFDIQGKLVFNKKPNTKRAILQTNLQSGIYIVRINIEGKIVNKKIVIE